MVCNPDGHVIGDMVLFGLENDRVNIVGRPPVANWIQFHAETGGYDVRVERDERAVNNPRPRKTYRFELQGPNAWALLETLNGGPLPQLKFFQMCELNIGGCTARALMHAFAGAPGLEFWGPAEQGPQVRAAILEAGEAFGLRQVGGRAYGSVCVEAGWIPSPLQAIYTGEAMRPYREWLGADSFEANASLGGSFYSDKVEDYYLTPWDLDYGRLVKFDHDFIGREALQRMADGPHRAKVTLEWNADDVLAVHASQLRPGENGKYMEAPTNHYAAHPYDKVISGGRTVGVSTYAAHVAADRQWISLAILDPEAPDTAYRLGRLFALLDAVGPLDERPSSPNIRFRRLTAAAPAAAALGLSGLAYLRLAGLRARNGPQAGALKPEIDALLRSLWRRLPAYLSPDSQARFALGLYQQSQALVRS